MMLEVMPEECRSIPIAAPKDWNQKAMRQPAQYLVTAVLKDGRLCDHRARQAALCNRPTISTYPP
jgi:hypothetical protein